MRSLTDPKGFWLSSLAKMRTSVFGDSSDTSTRGVWPMRSSTLSLTLAMVSMSLCLSEPSHANRAAVRPIPDNTDGLRQDSTRPSWSHASRRASAHGDGLLGDLAVDDAVAAQRRVQVVAQADDGVVPGG